MLSLDKERETYDASLADMVKGGEGHYVVIRGDQVRKLLPTYQDALAWGYDSFGLESFLVKQVTAIEPSVYMSRFVGKCAD